MKRNLSPLPTFCCAACWAWLLVCLGVVAAPAVESPAGADSQPATAANVELSLPNVAIENFSLRDFRGKTFALADYAQSKVVVLAFVGCECPVARLAIPRLFQLSKQFAGQGVEMLLIDSNSQDSLSKMTLFARENKIELPLLKDVGNVLADQLTADRTPEVFVLDSDRRVRYRGRVDDQNLVGRQRPRATRDDLKIAIEELLAGQEVSVPVTPTVGCHIGRVPREHSGAAGKFTYHHDIAPLLAERCVACHRDGEVAPFSLTAYDDVVGWGETIREVISAGRMPPWLANPQYGKFANDCRLTDAQKQLICDWLDAGAPEGDPAERVPTPELTQGWQIPQPEDVFYIADQPVDVPAEGVVKYQHFVIDPGFKEDRWIQFAEARPGNRAVVHHIVVNFIPPGGRPRIGLNGVMVGYAPGMPPIRMPAGLAMHVPAGSKILFQLHYTPNGTATQDRSSLGIVYADPASVKRRVESCGAANPSFEIPPGDPNFEVRAKYQFTKPALLVSLTPHMHVRGKSFRYEADYPDGRHEILLDVPAYDFNWQLRYELAEPRQMPVGAVVTCTSHYDNSAANVANPDPSSPVHWGDQTWEEMMIGYMATVSEAMPSAPSAPAAWKVRDDAEGQALARSRVEQGIEALGGAARLAAHPVLSFKMRGKLFLGQGTVAYDGEVIAHPAGRQLHVAADGSGFKFGVVVDGDRGWFKFNDRVIEMPAEALDEQCERMLAEQVALLFPLLATTEYRLSAIDDAKIGDKPADGVVARRDGHRDIKLFFDPQTHLLLKLETPINENGKDIVQELLYEDYRDIDGVRRPAKMITRWDGAERAERDIWDYQAADKAADEAFAKP